MRDFNVTSFRIAFRNTSSVRLVILALSAVAGSVASAVPLWAQQPGGGPPSSGHRGPSAAPSAMSRMPVNGPMSGPGGASRRPVAGSATVPKGPAPELKIDSVTLPEGFAPPSDKDPLMEIDQPLATPDEIIKLKKDFNNFKKVLNLARLSDTDKVAIRNGIRFCLAEMCQQQKRAELSKLHEDLVRQINGAGQAPENPKTVKDFRQYVLQELLNQATPLLDTQNFYVRLHLAILFGQLDLTEENSRIPTKQEAFSPASVPLIKLLLDPNQHEAIKVAATNGLARILRMGNPDVGIRTNIANALISELKNSKSHPWYQMRLVGTLGLIDIELDQTRKPFVVESLLRVLSDKDRKWQVRAEAAYALGRVPLPAACNPPSVPRAIAAFTLELAKAAQQQPQQGDRDPKWKAEFTKVYLAFQQKDKDDFVADKRNPSKAGLLNNTAAQAKPTYGLIVPMTAAILHGQRLTVQQVQALEASLGPAAAADSSKSSDAPAVTTNASGSKQ